MFFAETFCNRTRKLFWHRSAKKLGGTMVPGANFSNETGAKHLKALVFLYASEESVDCHLLSSFCDDSNLHISLFVLSTM